MSGGNLRSPIGDTFVAYAVRAAQGIAGWSRVLNEECVMGTEYPGTERVLVNNVLLSGRSAAHVATMLEYRGACRVGLAPAPAGAGLTIRATATFRDAWLQPRFSKQHSLARTGTDGTRSQVSMIRADHIVVSVASFHGDRVLAVPFRDYRFFAIFIVGRHLREATAHAYFDSRAFLDRSGFRAVDARLTIPRVRLSSISTHCIGSCSDIRVVQHVTLALSPAGAGSAPSYPKSMTMLIDPRAGLLWATYHWPFPRADIAVDRPFYLAILDAKTQRVLFHAFVEQPTY